jgi:hypothetical protein
MADNYIEYFHDETNVLARWHGGEYIELGYIASSDTGPFNDKGEPSYRKGEFVALEVINVWDHAKDEARIPFTLEALEQKVIDHLDEEGLL